MDLSKIIKKPKNRVVTVSVALEPEQIKILKARGFNVSAFLRELVNDFLKNEQTNKGEK